MHDILKQNFVEALIGLAVIFVAIWFASFAWSSTGGGIRADALHVNALFPNVNGINVGADVRVAGLKIGSVASQKLDPKTYMVDVTLALDPKVKLPADSSAAITSEGLLGGNYIAILPGGDPAPLKAGDVIVDTQGSVDLMSMVGQFINKSGDSGAQGTEATPQ